MLQLTTKWMTNTLAKKSIYNNDYIECIDNKRLYIVGVGNFTSSCKMTFNYEVRDDNENVLLSGENAYLDALTKIILGSSPKSKVNKEKKESEATKEAKQTKKGNKDSLLLTFDSAFERACKEIESYKKVAKILGKYDTKDTIELTMCILKEANENEHTRIKEAKKSEELKSLKQTLELAKSQGNNMLVDAISDMIMKKEQE